MSVTKRPPGVLEESHRAVLIGLHIRNGINVLVSDLRPFLSYTPTAIAAYLRTLATSGLVAMSWVKVDRTHNGITRLERCKAYSLTQAGWDLSQKLLREKASTGDHGEDQK
jgi:DNA-binding MarR family transcriptional regulator